MGAHNHRVGLKAEVPAIELCSLREFTSCSWQGREPSTALSPCLPTAAATSILDFEQYLCTEGFDCAASRAIDSVIWPTMAF